MPCGWNSNNSEDGRGFRMGMGMGADWFAPNDCKTGCKDEGGGPAGKLACEAACDLGIPKPKPEGGANVVPPRIEPMWVIAAWNMGLPIPLVAGQKIVIITQVQGSPKWTYKGKLHGYSKYPIKVRVHDVGKKGTQLIALVSNVPREELREGDGRNCAIVKNEKGQKEKICWSAKGGWR